MRLQKLIEKKDIGSNEISELVAAKEIRAARTLLKVIELFRGYTREQNESKPKISDNVTEDMRFLAGYIQCCNDLLDLPRQAKERIEHLPEQ